MSKKSGFMGALESVGLVESDAPAISTEAATAPVSIAMPAIGTPIIQPISYVGGATVLSPEDQARLHALEAQVYAGPSSYVIFQKVRESLGNTTDIPMVFRVLSAANPGVTAQKVIADIEQHLGVIASKRSEMDAQVAQARSSRIDGPKQQIADLTAATQAAMAEIAQRTAKINDLMTSIATSEKAITEGMQHFQAVADQLSAPLLQTKTLLSQ